MNDTSSTPRWTLRQLPFAARLTLAVFLVSVGIGYFSALVQLHFQHAKRGNMLPTGDDAVEKFHGQTGAPPMSQLELLLSRDDEQPFNGSGQMAAAFTRRSEGWKKAIEKKAKALRKDRRSGKPNEEKLKQGEVALRAERETERKAVLAWARAGASKSDYENDQFCLPEELAKQPIAEEFKVTAADAPTVKIKSIFDARCVSCHAPNAGRDAKAEQYPLEKYDQIVKYMKVQTSSAMALERLAQTTHVHLLGFSMLYGLTGLLLALTSYAGWIRVPLAPLALAAQVVDISFWWLARMDAPYGPAFAHAIPISGAIVAGALGLQILLTLFDLFGRIGKSVLFILIVTTACGGYGMKERVIDKHLESEKPTAGVVEGAK
jgi:hypothetical protein